MIKLSNQQQKVYDALDKNRGTWLSSEYFVYTLHLSEFHTRMNEIEAKGIHIDINPVIGKHGYKSYMLPIKNTLF